MMESLPVEMRMKIMEHLSNADLLKISLVNKLLNFEARSLMRDRGTYDARLRAPCKDVVPFLEDLEKINVAPWSGISFCWYSGCHYESCRRQSLSNRKTEPKFLSILARLPWKRLSVNFTGRMDAPKRCPATQLLRKIMHNFSGVLEQISLSDNYETHVYMQNFIRDASYDSGFPRLKILKMFGRLRHHGSFLDQDEFIKEMVWRAPNLQELHMTRMLDFSENILEGTSVVLTVTDYECSPLTREFPQSVASTVKLEKITLNGYSVPFTMVERLNRIVPLILQSSFSTLKSLSVKAVFMLPLMCYGIALENVTDLKIFMNFLHLDHFQPQIIAVLKRFDFTRVFPGLSQVDIYPPGSEVLLQHQINELVAQGNAALFQGPQPNRAANIKSLRYWEPHLTTDATLPFLAQMLPCIEKLKGNVRPGREAPYQIIWEQWPKLKELEITLCRSGHYTPWNENLDSVFCGIFPAEVAHLRNQDDAYLQAVNTVPVMPSIDSFHALRTVKLIYEEQWRFRAQVNTITSPSKLIFSKVTGLIAFQRCPNLSVTIEPNLYGISDVGRYMTPYASIEKFSRERITVKFVPPVRTVHR